MASTGGQLMPLIMGAGAFVMASYTAIPYATIVAVSVKVPAFALSSRLSRFVVRVEAGQHDADAGIDMTVDMETLSGGLVFIMSRWQSDDMAFDRAA